MTTDPSTSGNALAQAREEHATPTPSAGDLWRVRWNDQAGIVLVLAVAQDKVRVAPVSLNEMPDETAALAPAAMHSLNFDIAIWDEDAAEVSLRVLDYKLGHLDRSLESLQRGTINWGPTDPRTLTRARLQDLVETLEAAQWAPTGTSDFDLRAALAGADVRAISGVLGSPSRAAALRRGQLDLTHEEANQLSELVGVPASDLVTATQPPLPEDLVAAMDLPNVRSMVDRLAARRDTDEVSTWRSAAYGVQALAARDHDRRFAQWEARIRAYFEAQLRENPGEADR